jgi:hypothetical protein
MTVVTEFVKAYSVDLHSMRVSPSQNNAKSLFDGGLNPRGFRAPIPWKLIPLTRYRNPLDNLFLLAFEHAEVLRHVFSFMLKQLTMGFRVSRNENPHRVPDSWEGKSVRGS